MAAILKFDVMLNSKNNTFSRFAYFIFNGKAFDLPFTYTIMYFNM